MTKRNKFLNAALEELAAGPGVGSAEGAPIVTSTDVQSDADAVAALMEKNSELTDSNATLEAESFDNDLDAVETSSDSVQGDLEEAVAAGVALEHLVNVIDMTIKAGQANAGAVAGFAMALEQISYRAGLDNPIPALEAEALQLEGPAAQAEAIASTAMDKAKNLAERLVEGIKKIVGWLLNLIRGMIARSTNLAGRAREAYALLPSIDESKTIDSGAFIASLRLVEGAGDPTEQFMKYANTANKTLYGFFNQSFLKDFREVAAAAATNKENYTDNDIHKEVHDRLVNILRTLLSVIYTESGTGANVSANLSPSVGEKDLTVGLTPATVGGVQLYLAATLESNDGTFYVTTGVAKNQPKFAAPASIPVVNKGDAKRILGNIEQWMRSQKHIEDTFKTLQSFTTTNPTNMSLNTVKMYLNTLTALASGCVPHLLRLNIQNSASFIAYVEKSAAVSRVAPAKDDK